MNIRRIAIMGAAGLTVIGVGCESTKDSSPDPTNQITATVPTTKAPTTTTTTTAPPTTTTTVEEIDNAALVYGMMDGVWADTTYSDQDTICMAYDADPAYAVETIIAEVDMPATGIGYNDWYDGVDVYLWGVC